MKLLACIKKDIRLLSGGGPGSLLLLLLPAALLLLVLSFMSGMTSVNSYTEPFSIAVRDEDQSFPSGVLMTQLKKVSLFREVITLEENQTDEEMLAQGCAAVITIPKNFFYDLYDMSSTEIDMVLNGNMPKEAAAVRSAVSAIVGILEENQRLYSADAKIRYGNLEGAVKDKVNSDYSGSSLTDVLLRLEYFSIDSLYEDEALSQMVFFAAGICSMFLLFFPLCILRSLYEEKDLGITTRLAVGRGSLALLLSKLLVSFIFTAVPVAVVVRMIRLPEAETLIPAFFILFFASFCFFFVLSLLCRSPERTQLIGNVLILMMLLAGGAIFPYRLLPESIRPLSQLSLAFYVTRGIYAAVLGKGTAGVLQVLIPVMAVIPVLLAAAWLLYGGFSLQKEKR